MRFFLALAAALALLTAQAQAQTNPPPAATDTAPAKPAPKRPGLQARFDAANTTHDGHLTKDQAVAAKWAYVANNFAAMDKTNQGFVTVADIRAFAKARRASKAKPTTTASAPAQPAPQ